MPEAVKVLNAAVAGCGGVTLDWCELPVGYPSYLKSGETLPASTLEALYGLDGWILGPIGHMAYPKDDPKAINPHPILRRNFDLASNIRPARSHPSLPCLRQDVDLVIIGRTTRASSPTGICTKAWGECMPTPDMALSLRVITRRNSSMVARTAFELAGSATERRKSRLSTRTRSSSWVRTLHRYLHGSEQRIPRRGVRHGGGGYLRHAPRHEAGEF